MSVRRGLTPWQKVNYLLWKSLSPEAKVGIFMRLEGEEHHGTYIVREDVLREFAKGEGIPQETIDKMWKEGEIYQPRPGWFSTVVRPTGGTRGGHPQEITMDEIKKLVDEVPDVNDPARINYWVAKDDILIYLEGWSDDCLAGTGFPLMAEGNHENKINYIEDLTPGILKRKAEEKGLRLIKGGFMETEGATNLYGVTYGVYRKLGGQTGERTRDILRRAGYRA